MSAGCPLPLSVHGFDVKAPLPVGVWTYVVATLDSGGNERMYVDGALADGPEPGVSIESQGQPLEIGPTNNANGA